MSKLKSHWERVHTARIKAADEITLKSINIFTAIGSELDSIGELLELPRPKDLASREPIHQRAYRIALLSRCLVRIGTYAHPSSDIELNSAAVAMGTFQNDPKRNHPEDYESRAGLEDSLKEMMQDWLAEHGVDANHICEECGK